MTEAEARAALRAFVGIGNVEPWIAAQPWEATPSGWTVPVPLEGWIFRLGGRARRGPRFRVHGPGIAGGVDCASAMTDTPARPEPELVTAEGPWGGPVYRHRGAEIRCAKGGHVCALLMEGHPLHGHTFGVAGTTTPLVDL